MNTNHSKTIDNKLIDLRRQSDKIFELTEYWSPPLPPWKPLKKTSNSSLRIACVVEDRLYHGLRFEGEMMLLTPHNWKQVLKYGKPDFLLMESIWTTSTGHWHMGQCPAPSHEQDELLAIVALTKKLSIPTVFWITKGHEYHEHYKDFATHFDYVFCADPQEVGILKNEGVKADTLLPCVQPALYNPFRMYDHYKAFDIDILYDGWADLDRLTGQLGVLSELTKNGLSIIESRYKIFHRRVNILPYFKENILGCVSRQNLILALKYAKIYVTFDYSLSSITTQQWMALEAVASRLPVIHHGSLSKDDIRNDFIVDFPNQIDFLEECAHSQENDLYRERKAHLGWRTVYQNHTFSHRVQAICQKIGIEHRWKEFPKASLITPTFREHLLPKCIDTYKRQTYPNKELVIVFNGDSIEPPQILNTKNRKNDIRICIVPRELFAGACLNAGYLEAKGDYCFRVDDDDLYGDNYILDLMLYLKAIDVNIFGKPPAGLFFEGKSKAYLRNNQYTNCILSKANIQSGRVWLGGNTIASNKATHLINPYNDYSYGAADSDYQLNSKEDIFALMDNFNILAERRKDQSTHTWKIDPEKIKNNDSKKISDLIF